MYVDTDVFIWTGVCMWAGAYATTFSIFKYIFMEKICQELDYSIANTDLTALFQRKQIAK